MLIKTNEIKKGNMFNEEEILDRDNLVDGGVVFRTKKSLGNISQYWGFDEKGVLTNVSQTPKITVEQYRIGTKSIWPRVINKKGR